MRTYGCEFEWECGISDAAIFIRGAGADTSAAAAAGITAAAVEILPGAVDVKWRTSVLEDGGDDLVRESDSRRRDGVESALEEDSLGSETFYFLFDATNLGLDGNDFVGC